MAAAITSRAPGVYLEEERRAPSPRFEVGVPAFLGRISSSGGGLPPFAGSARAVVPIDEAAWSALEAQSDALHTRWAEGYLGFAVRGFFENGGRRCYLCRLDQVGGSLDAALDALDPVEDFDLVAAPDTAPRVTGSLESPLGPADAQAKLIHFCGRRTGCFAVLDGIGAGLRSPALTTASIKAATATAKSGLSDALLRNAALYAPWIKVRGACPTCLGNGQTAGAECASCEGTGHGFVPPSGHMAGVYARTDRRTGVHKAPANEVLQGVVDLELQLVDAAIVELKDAGVNSLRALPGRGIRAWGARTLGSGDPSFAFVSARRVFLTVARWLEQAMTDAAFEPNDLRLWARIGRDVGAFLDDLFRRGALAGRSAGEAFYVKCDAETNPPEVRRAGEVVTEVGLALARPSEFVVVRLISGADGASIAAAAPGGA